MMQMRSRRGSKAIEFAISLPIYVVIMSGIVDFGWYFKQRMNVTMAARDAVRAGSLVPIDEEPVPEAVQHGHDTLAVAGITGEVVCEYAGDAPDQAIACDVSAPFSGIIGITPLPDAFHASAVMRMEEQR